MAASENVILQALERRLVNLEQAATANSDNLKNHKLEYDQTMTKLNEQSAMIKEKLNKQDTMFGEIKTWATVSETNQRDIKAVLENQTRINKAHADEVAARAVISARLDSEKSQHEAFTMQQSKKLDLEVAALKAFAAQVNSYINSSGVKDQTMQDLATGVSTAHQDSQNRLLAMETRICQNEAWISQNVDKGNSSATGMNPTQKEKPIMEYHGISSVGVMDKEKYAEWREKFHDKMEQARPGITSLLKYIEANTSEEIQDGELARQSFGINLTETKSELMSVLIDITTGEARGKIKATKDPRDGIHAYRLMH